MDVLGRVPSGRRQVAWAELGKDMDCSWHVGVRRPGESARAVTMLCVPPWSAVDLGFSTAALTDVH